MFGLVKKRLRKEALPPREDRDMALLADDVANRVMGLARACEICGYASADNVLVGGGPRCPAHKHVERGKG